MVECPAGDIGVFNEDDAFSVICLAKFGLHGEVPPS